MAIEKNGQILVSHLILILQGKLTTSHLVYESQEAFDRGDRHIGVRQSITSIDKNDSLVEAVKARADTVLIAKVPELAGAVPVEVSTETRDAAIAATAAQQASTSVETPPPAPPVVPEARGLFGFIRDLFS